METLESCLGGVPLELEGDGRIFIRLYGLLSWRSASALKNFNTRRLCKRRSGQCGHTDMLSAFF